MPKVKGSDRGTKNVTEGSPIKQQQKKKRKENWVVSWTIEEIKK